MASLDSRDGRAELEGKGEQDAASAPRSHVTYGVEEEGDGTRSGPTLMQKLREKVSEYENHLKGKESSEMEDPHPELAYIRPGDGHGVEELQEGKQHGGVPMAALGNDVPAHVTRDSVSSVKDHESGGHKKHFSGEGADEPTVTSTYTGHKKHFSGEGADEPTVMERIKEKVTEAGNHLKGTSGADPHPELAYIPPQPKEHQPGLFSKMDHKFRPKGTGSTEVGTGYEEDSEDALNPATVPKYDEGVKKL